jgi:erythromycin esterase-like protein
MELHNALRPVKDANDFDPVVELAADARFVLLGEATHGTHEFYAQRAEITKRLITERGFNAVAVEADWPDAYRVNRYVRKATDDPDAIHALDGFKRFPTWMWRNSDVVDFVEWLRSHNEALAPGEPKVGFYGMDLYSLRSSMQAVLDYLGRADPDAGRRALERYACFDHFADDFQTYGFLTGLGINKSCEREVIDVLVDLESRAMYAARDDVRIGSERLFNAVQNARVVKNAERYYREMFLERTSTWNLRDRHMVETLEDLSEHLQGQSGRAKIVVWAHNSHVGDARATTPGDRGEVTVGQLIRQKFGGSTLLVGFTTSHGTVTAASDWGGPTERKCVRPPLPGSYEKAFHEAGTPSFLLDWVRRDAPDVVLERLLERAIGVIYRPETERLSHYFYARMFDQFDVVLHFDETSAVEPLDYGAEWGQGELPETYPFAV